MKKTCEVCGTEFEAVRDTARYCSGGCRKQAQREVRGTTGSLRGTNDLSGTDNVPVREVSGTSEIVDTRHPMNKVGPLVVSTTPEQEAALRAKYPNLTAIRKALMNQYIPPMVQSDEVRRKKRLAQLRGWEGVSAVRGEVEAEDGPTL